MAELVMSSHAEYITPEKAAMYLSKNNVNRPLDRNRVLQYADEMSKNKWRLTHEGIAFSTDGDLLDGQHRLHAVIKSGATIKTVVFENCPPDSFAFINTAKARTAGDVLSIEGVQYANQAAATVKNIMLWRNGLKAVTVNAKTARGMSNFDIAQFVKSDNKVMRSCVTSKKYNGSHTGITTSQLGLLVWLWLHVADDSTVWDFLEKWRKGSDLAENSPIFQLREFLRKDKDKGGRLMTYEKYYLILSSWKLYRQGKPLKKITIPPYESLNPASLQSYII